GKDPQVVPRFGIARIKGMQQSGVSACAKHFRGMRHATLASDLRLPTIDSSWDDMRAKHLPPFVAAVAEGVDCLMTSHPVYPNLDPARIPATFSRRIVHDHLRVEMGFSGVIVSDDLEMGAIGEACPIGEAVVKTAAAGHDLLLVCHTEPAQRAAAAALLDACRSGALARREHDAAVERVRRLRPVPVRRPPLRVERPTAHRAPDAGARARRRTAPRSVRRGAAGARGARHHRVRLPEVPARRGDRSPAPRVTGPGARPGEILAIDWGATPAKRQLCRAVLRRGSYVVAPPRPVEDVSALELAPDALVAFDCPIGLPDV